MHLDRSISNHSLKVAKSLFRKGIGYEINKDFRKIIEDKIKMLEETGYAMPKRIGVRKRMGIEPAPEIESKEIKQILGKIRRKAK